MSTFIKILIQVLLFFLSVDSIREGVFLFLYKWAKKTKTPMDDMLLKALEEYLKKQ